MATEPIKDLIPPMEENPGLLNILLKFSKGIEETLNFGSHVFDWCNKAATGGEENIPIFFPFRHILELIASISVLVKDSCIDPCKILLRSYLESLLNILYILERDSLQREMAFLYCYHNQNLKKYKELDPSTNEGRKFLEEIKDSKYSSKIIFPQIPQHKQRIQSLENKLKSTKYVNEDNEYKRMKNKYAKWYSFYNGPKDIRELAKYLKLFDLYYILYGKWSGVVHGTDVIEGKLSRSQNGKAEIVAIKFPTDSQIVTQFTLSFSFMLFQELIGHYVPDKKVQYEMWYVKEIRDLYLWISGKNIINIKI